MDVYQDKSIPEFKTEPELAEDLPFYPSRPKLMTKTKGKCA